MNHTGQLRRRRRRRRLRIKPLRLTLFVATVIFLVFFVQWFIGLGNIDGFCPGVYVNGISLAGYRYEEGLAHIEQLAYDRLNNSTYQLIYQDKSWTFTAAQLGATMEVGGQVQKAWMYGHEGNWFQRKAQIDEVKGNPVYLTSEVHYNEDALDQFVAEIKNAIDVEPTSAGIVPNGPGDLVITPSVNGLSVDAVQLKAQIGSMLREGTEQVAEIVPQVITPAITDADLQGTTERIARCSTDLETSGTDRTSNVRLALSKFNGMMVEPGQMVSFNQVVGKRTEARGFKPAREFAGDTVIDGIGGGVCQASTTLYGAVMRAGMTKIDRSSHTMVVGYVELSQDAAVTDQGNVKDLVFRNDTAYPIYIYTEVTEKRATVIIYGKPPQYKIELKSVQLETILPDGLKQVPDTSGKHTSFPDQMVLKEEGKNGAKSECYRVYYDRETGKEERREKLSEDYYYPLKPQYWVGVEQEPEPDLLDEY